MTVRFYRQRPTGSEEIGVLVLRDGRLVAEPQDSIALNGILDEPLEVYHEDRPRTILHPTQEPAAFLTALPTQYHGTYFWAGQVEN